MSLDKPMGVFAGSNEHRSRWSGFFIAVICAVAFVALPWFLHGGGPVSVVEAFLDIGHGAPIVITEERAFRKLVVIGIALPLLLAMSAFGDRSRLPILVVALCAIVGGVIVSQAYKADPVLQYAIDHRYIRCPALDHDGGWRRSSHYRMVGWTIDDATCHAL